LTRDEETEIAQGLVDGDQNAFERFVQHFREKLFQYSWLMCGQREDAEEVAQETLLSVFRNLDQLREPRRLRSWVFRIAKNACLMKRRRSVFAPERELSLDDYLPASTLNGEHRHIEIADWSRLPEDELLRLELRNQLHTAIRALPELYRTVLLLRDVEGLTTEDTARTLDVSVDVVKTRLHRARLALRQKLDGYLRIRADAT